MELVIGSDFYLTLNGVRDASTGSYLNSGSATYTLYDSTDTTTGITGTLSYVSASNGNYLATVESSSTSSLTVNARYYFLIDFTQSGYNRRDRVDVTVVAAGEVLIDAQIWQDYTGNSLTAGSADETACIRWCSAVRNALLKKLRPYLPEPQTLTFYCDAPPDECLVLPVRPIRSITSIYVNWGANGQSANFTSDDLLVSGEDYYLPLDPVEGISRKGHVYRRGGAGWFTGGSTWGVEAYAPPGRLGGRLGSAKGAVKVVAACGEPTVPDDVRGAAVYMVTKLFTAKKTGAPASSESWNGYSMSSAPGAIASLWRDDYVADILKLYAPVHVG